jgi:hypothetical protein
MAGLVYKAGYRKRSRSKKMRGKRMRNRPKGLKRSRKTSRRRSRRRSRSRTKGSKRRRSRSRRKRRTKRGGVKFVRSKSLPAYLGPPKNPKVLSSSVRKEQIRNQLGVTVNPDLKKGIQKTKKVKDQQKVIQKALLPTAITSVSLIIKDTNWMDLYKGLGVLFQGIETIAYSLSNPMYSLLTRSVDVASNNQVVLGFVLASLIYYNRDISQYLQEEGKKQYTLLRQLLMTMSDQSRISNFLSNVFGTRAITDRLTKVASKLNEETKNAWNEQREKVKVIMQQSSQAAFQQGFRRRHSNQGGPAPPSSGASGFSF